MAFIVPLVVGEQLLVKDPRIAGLFPEWMRQPKRWVAVVLLLTVATNQEALTANPGAIAVVVPGTALVLAFAVVTIWGGALIAVAVMMAMSVHGAFPNVLRRFRHETAVVSDPQSSDNTTDEGSLTSTVE